MGIIKDFLSDREGPARRNGSLAVGTMASGAEIALPYVAIRGAHPGKTLWLHGQVHGDEINGLIAALRFANALDPRRMHGNVVVTPTGNPQALDIRRKRNPYDDLDLDQCYPGSAQGLISERLAHALFSEVRGTADLLINLHTMNALFDSKAYAVYKLHPESGVSEQTLLSHIALFEPNVSCRMDVGGKGELPGNIAGGLDYQCLAAGIPAFMLELGGGSRFEAHNVALAERGFGRLARQLGILPDGDASGPDEVRRVTRRGWITFKAGGLFVAAVAAGDTVAAGTLLGTTMDLHGQSVEEIRVDGPRVIIGLRRDPVVHTGERTAFVAYDYDQVKVEP